MDATKFIVANVVVANLIKAGVNYFSQHEDVEVSHLSVKPEENPSPELYSPPVPEPSWFLPYILALQISVFCLFFQTLRKYDLPSSRARKVLIGLIWSDLLFTITDVLHFTLYSNYGIDVFGPVSNGYCEVFSCAMDILQHLSVGLHLFLCGDVSGMLPPSLKSPLCVGLIGSLVANAMFSTMSYEYPEGAAKAPSCTIYRNLIIDSSYAQRLSSLHLLPCIGLAVIFIHQRASKLMRSGRQEKLPNEKGDEEMYVLNVKKFTLRTMICHYAISALYFFITIGIKIKHPRLIEAISQFDTPENMLRKFAYLHQVANTLCLFACLNLEATNSEQELMEEFGDIDDLNPQQHQSHQHQLPVDGDESEHV
ncbi:unnamed protein product [Mesocestoides corti]|uniref:G protein-coupled receptor n=1 Tax=Mesocestoides corti TaxID=53468 RepID=A0A0R3U3R1_MESCO|nr:unnamed protein product [Mesocestoides corti]